MGEGGRGHFRNLGPRNAEHAISKIVRKCLSANMSLIFFSGKIRCKYAGVPDVLKSIPIIFSTEKVRMSCERFLFIFTERFQEIILFLIIPKETIHAYVR